MLVNLEDHIEVVMLPETSAELCTSVIKFAKLVKAFEKIGFASDPLLGYLTVNPQHLGSALSLKCKFAANDKLLDSKV